MMAMEELIRKEMFKSSSLGEYIASNEAIHFFKKLLKSTKLEIREVDYGDPQAFSGFKMLCVECEAKEDLCFNNGALKYHKGDRIMLEVNCNEEEGYNVGDTFIEQIIGDYEDFVGITYIDFSKGYVI